MERVLRLNNTDQRITYGTSWTSIFDSRVGQNRFYSLTSTSGAELIFLFRGTTLRFYGRLGGGGGNVLFRLDGNDANMVLNGTNFDNGPALVWSAENLEDGDHQLYMLVGSLQQNGSVAVDYLEVENSSGQGFDLLWAGPNATNVPQEATIVDNQNQDVVLSNPFQWGRADGVQYYRGAMTWTTVAGASLNFSFDGVAIWYYSDRDKSHGFYTVSIDGSQPERLNGMNNGGHLIQQMLWSKTNLTPGRHNFTLKQDDIEGTLISLDFFRVLSANNTSALPSSTPTSQGAITPESKSNIVPLTTSALPSSTPTSTSSSTPASTDATTPESKSNKVPLAVGLTFGLLTLTIAAFYLQRRWRRQRAPVDALSEESLKP